MARDRGEGLVAGTKEGKDERGRNCNEDEREWFEFSIVRRINVNVTLVNMHCVHVVWLVFDMHVVCEFKRLQNVLM